MKYHRISIRTSGATCSCGHDAPARTGSQALGNGYRHRYLSIKEGDDAKVTDYRLCSKECLAGVDRPEQFKDTWHHDGCANFTSEYSFHQTDAGK